MSTPTVYRSPECRTAGLDWPEGHKLCPGPRATPAPGGGVPVEILRCDCGCHCGKRPETPARY